VPFKVIVLESLASSQRARLEVRLVGSQEPWGAGVGVSVTVGVAVGVGVGVDVGTGPGGELL
jgi:hypothetical protein